MKFVPCAIEAQDKFPMAVSIPIGRTRRRLSCVRHSGYLARSPARPSDGQEVVVRDVEVRRPLARSSAVGSNGKKMVLFWDIEVGSRRMAIGVWYMASEIPSLSLINVEHWYGHRVCPLQLWSCAPD